MKATHKRLTVATTAGAAAIAMAVLTPWTANAGHTNKVLEASLDGRSEVGPSPAMAGDPNGRGTAYVFGIDGDPTTLCYVLTVDKVSGEINGAHIHEGGAGSNGPVVASLAPPGDGNAADCLTEGEPGKFADGQTVAEILENPEDYYVNVHTSRYPGGAVRGQLAAER